jgi:WD40 repeat protein
VVGQAAFSPDGRSVVTASWDKTARLWDATSGELRAILTGHQNRVGRAAFSPDGRSVVTASWDKTARLWDAASGALRAILTGHQDRVGPAAFSPDGRWVVTTCWDKTARLWRILPNTQELIDYAMQIRPRMSDGQTIAPRTLTPEERQRFFLQ